MAFSTLRYLPKYRVFMAEAVCVSLSKLSRIALCNLLDRRLVVSVAPRRLRETALVPFSFSTRALP